MIKRRVKLPDEKQISHSWWYIYQEWKPFDNEVVEGVLRIDVFNGGILVCSGSQYPLSFIPKKWTTKVKNKGHKIKLDARWKYMAIDNNGDGYFYTAKPALGDDIWEPTTEVWSSDEFDTSFAKGVPWNEALYKIEGDRFIQIKQGEE